MAETKWTEADIKAAIRFMGAASKVAKRGKITNFACTRCGNPNAVASRTDKEGHLFASCDCGMRVCE